MSGAGEEWLRYFLEGIPKTANESSLGRRKLPGCSRRTGTAQRTAMARDLPRESISRSSPAPSFLRTKCSKRAACRAPTIAAVLANLEHLEPRRSSKPAPYLPRNRTHDLHSWQDQQNVSCRHPRNAAYLLDACHDASCSYLTHSLRFDGADDLRIRCICHHREFCYNDCVGALLP